MSNRQVSYTMYGKPIIDRDIGTCTNDVYELTPQSELLALRANASELVTVNARIAKLEALVAERDTMLGKRPCQSRRCSELNAARALLREVIADTGIVSHIDACQRAQSYLDANTQTGEVE